MIIFLKKQIHNIIFIKLLTIFIIILSSNSYANNIFDIFNKKGKITDPKNTGEYVIILHGIARSKKHMSNLAKYLSSNNYDVINLDYPSTDYDLYELSKKLKKEISLHILENKKVNFIGYSMGGLLVRIILNDQKYKNMGRAVQLAPPNQGSEVADLVQNNFLYKKFYGPAGTQLITDQKKIKDLLQDNIDYELGIIAGNFSIDPLSSAVIPGEDDGKVSVAATKLRNMKDHIVVNASHSFFPNNTEVHKQTLYFLQNGEFNKNINND